MRLLRHFWILVALTVSLPAWACSPPPQQEASGFVRHLSEHLPRNARGLMFLPPSGKLKASDFRLSSVEDRRPLKLRIRTVEGREWVRLEPENGFRPGARYRFRYLPAHGSWLYPDEQSVAIDTDAAATNGAYAIALAPQPVHRTITVMTGSGSCVEPAPATVQAFSYALPSAMEPYRDVLAYDASIDVATPGMTDGPRVSLDAWRNGVSLYQTRTTSLGWGYDDTYNARHNAVVAPCGRRWPRAKLHAAVSFPEVDDKVYRTQDAEVDLNRNVEGQCGRVETLVRTIAGQAPEPVLQRLCHIYLAGGGMRPLRTVALKEWESNLEYFSDGIAPSCNLVALASLWHGGLPPARVLDRLGAALHLGLSRAMPEDRDDALQGLAYLVDQLPPAGRPEAARRLIGPSRALIGKLIADPHTARRDQLVRLLGMGPVGPVGR